MATGMELQDLNSPNNCAISQVVAKQNFDADRFRSAFPALNSDRVYLDSAATSLKPQAMIDAVCNYYSQDTATSNRSLHKSAQEVTAQIELARNVVAKFIHATDHQQIVWTKGTTESINLVAQSYARQMLKQGDEIIVSDLEHHSNLLPWLIVAQQTGARVVKWSIDKDNLLDLINNSTRLVCITQMSNVTGYLPDLRIISQIVHQHNAVLMVDGAQGIAHQAINVTEMDIDFYAFSAHKLYGPTGVGALYAKTDLLKNMAVWQAGGKMLKQVSFAGFEPQESPYKFEAGTLNIAGILSFLASLTWLNQWNLTCAASYVDHLADKARSQLAKLNGIQFYSCQNSPIITFNIDGIYHNDIAILLSEQNIALRTGELCARPLMQKMGVQGVIRISIMPYNNEQDIKRCILALQQAIALLS